MEAQNLLRKREPYWDNVKGVLILLVTFAHFMPAATGSVSGAIYEGIYFFRGCFIRKKRFERGLLDLC